MSSKYPGAVANSVCAIHKSSCFSRLLRVPIAMRRFYKQTLWILQKVLLTNPDLHHRLIGKKEVFLVTHPEKVKTLVLLWLKLRLVFLHERENALGSVASIIDQKVRSSAIIVVRLRHSPKSTKRMSRQSSHTAPA